MRKLRATTPNGWYLDLEVDVYTRPIFDLLENGVNTQVILIKHGDGEQFIYELLEGES